MQGQIFSTKSSLMHILPKLALRVQPVGNVFSNNLVGDGGKSILKPLKISQDVTKMFESWQEMKSLNLFVVL